MTSNYDVYITSQRGDEHSAARLAKELRGFSLSTFHGPMPDGTLVAAAPVVLVVIGSGWMSLEAGNPEGMLHDVRHDVLLIPVLVDGAAMPDRKNFPAGLQHLCDRQAVSLRPLSWHSDLRDLVLQIKASVPASPAAPKRLRYDRPLPGAAAAARAPAPELAVRSTTPMRGLGCGAVVAGITLLGIGAFALLPKQRISTATQPDRLLASIRGIWAPQKEGCGHDSVTYRFTRDDKGPIIYQGEEALGHAVFTPGGVMIVHRQREQWAFEPDGKRLHVTKNGVATTLIRCDPAPD